MKLITLEQLSNRLNVDIELTDDDIAEMQDKIVALEEQLEETKSALDDYKRDIEEQNDNIDAFKEWLSEQFDKHDYTSIEVAIDDIAHEFKKTIKTISVF